MDIYLSFPLLGHNRSHSWLYIEFSNVKTLRKAAQWAEGNPSNTTHHTFVDLKIRTRSQKLSVLLSLPVVCLESSCTCGAIVSRLWTLGPLANNNGVTGDIPISISYLLLPFATLFPFVAVAALSLFSFLLYVLATSCFQHAC